MAARIVEIVAARGKMHNPETDSGGILTGTVAAVGERYARSAGGRGAGRHARLAHAHPAAPRRRHRPRPGLPAGGGRRHRLPLRSRRVGRPCPTDMPLATAVEVYDVCAAADQTRRPGAGRRWDGLRSGRGTRGEAGAGRGAGRNGPRHARRRRPRPRRRRAGPGAGPLRHRRRRRPARPPGGARGAAGRPARPPRTSPSSSSTRAGCEAASILLTADVGTVLFFSMATSFSTAALAADGIGSSARMLVGSGYTARPRRLRPRSRAPLRGAAPCLRHGWGAGVTATEVQTRWGDMDMLGSRRPYRRPGSAGGGAGRLPRPARDPAGPVRRRAAARSASTAKSTRRRRR